MTLTLCNNPILLTAVSDGPCISHYAFKSIGPARVWLTLSTRYEFLQYISNTTGAGKTLPIKVMPVSNCHYNKQSE